MSPGKFNAAGLPDISGYVVNITAQVDYTSGLSVGGAFAVPEQVETVTYSDKQVSTGHDGFTFKASRSSTRYGESDTVMPASCDMLVGVYLGSGLINCQKGKKFLLSA